MEGIAGSDSSIVSFFCVSVCVSNDTLSMRCRFLPSFLVLLDFNEVLLGFTEFYRVFLQLSQVVIGFYMVLLGFPGILLGFTRFYRVLPGFSTVDPDCYRI